MVVRRIGDMKYEDESNVIVYSDAKRAALFHDTLFLPRGDNEQMKDELGDDPFELGFYDWVILPSSRFPGHKVALRWPSKLGREMYERHTT